MLFSYIESWGINVDTYNSSLRAFAELVNHAESDYGYTTVIVDSLNLDMDPIQFAKYIQLDSGLSNLHLIHISPELSLDQKKQLLDAGYTTLLNTPLDKTILLDALHDHKAKTTTGSNITRFIKHYSSKTNERQPLDILLAISNKAEQELFSVTLEHNGQRVYTVSSGSQALDALNTHQFDLVILDFNMPDIEGKEIIRLYYYTYLNEDWVPFIALVNEANPEVMGQCREAEVNAILVRPVEKNELLITVSDIASSKTKRAESIDKHWQPPHIHETQIHDNDDQILNAQTLMQLEELSSSNNFLSQLTTKFNHDMDILMDGLEQSIQNNCFTDFKDLIYALKDSSCNLGADSLHKLSLLALQINQREFQGQADIIFKEIRETLSKTKYALQNHVVKQNSSATESE
jgi:two-component system sensor histidine kinase RpfC